MDMVNNNIVIYDISIDKLLETLNNTKYITDKKAIVYVLKDNSISKDTDIDDKDTDNKALHKIKELRYDMYNSEYDILLNTETNPIKDGRVDDTFMSFLINKCGYNVYTKALVEYMHKYDIDSYIHMDIMDKEQACMEYIYDTIKYQSVLLIVIE